MFVLTIVPRVLYASEREWAYRERENTLYTLCKFTILAALYRVPSTVAPLRLPYPYPTHPTAVYSICTL